MDLFGIARINSGPDADAERVLKACPAAGIASKADVFQEKFLYVARR
jgi:hypothetical protein